MCKRLLVLVTGSRNWSDRSKIESALMDTKQTYGKFTLMSGNASGADKMCEDVAEKLDCDVERYPADWNKYGKSAGPIRNNLMISKNPDIVLAFVEKCRRPDCDCRGFTHGTQHCVNQALREGIPVYFIHE